MRGTTAIGEVGASQLFTKGRQRRQITVLVAFIMVGAAVFGLWQSYLGFVHRRQTLESNTLERALASARIVDRETSAAGHLLRSLSTSPALAKGDLATFYEQMRAAAPRHTWLILNDATGQVLNTSRPYGSPLAAATNYDWVHDESVNEIRKRRSWISNRLYGPISRAYSVAVSARIDGADGEMKYILSLVMADPELRALDGQYRKPGDMPVNVYDRKFDLIVAGETGTEFDQSDIAAVRTHVQQGQRSGTIHAGGLFETSRFTAFAVASDSGWTAIAQADLSLLGDLPGSLHLRLVGFGVFSLLLMGLGLALIVNRWFGLPFEILKRASDEAKQRHRTYWEQSCEGLYMLNVSPTGGFSYEAINPRLENWVGLSNEEVRGKSPHELLPTAMADNAVRNYRRCVSTGRSLQFENSRESGTVRTWETTLTPVFGPSGKVVQLLGRSNDITERLKMQRRLKDSEEQLAAVARAVPGILFVATADGTIGYFNDQLAQYAGVPENPSEPIKLTSLVHPDDRRSVVTASARAAAKPEPFSIECRICSATGTYRWFLVRAAPVQDGDAIRWFGIATDIDDRKQLSAAVANSRRRLQRILEGISDCYFAIDRQSRIVALNTRAADWFGRPADLLIGVDYRTLGQMTPSSPEFKLRQPFHAAVEDVITRGVRIQEELPSKMYAGRWIDIQASPADEGAVILFKDITDRKLSEQRAAQSLGLIQSSLDALTARVAILDGSGFVIAVNKTWQTFNTGKPQMNPGSNYKESCEVANLRDALIRVVNGHSGIKLTYDLATDSGKRWYQVTVAPFKQTNFSRIVVAHEDVTEIVKTRESIADLHGRLISLQEEERQRIAIELHDSTAQYLVAAGLNLVGLRNATRTIDGVSALCDEIDDLINSALKELRVFTYLLHPPALSRDGLKTTLERFVAGFQKRSSLLIDLVVDDEVESLPFEFQRTVLRITQEALANAHRHAAAKSVDIKMTIQDDKLRLVVCDDGQGMPHVSMDELAKGLQLGVGIVGMKTRTDQLGGEIEFVTNSSGTTVIVVVPLPDIVRRQLRAPADKRVALAIH